MIKNRVGETNIANNGQVMTIIEYRNCNDIDIEFEDGTVVKNKNYGNFKLGNIKNPNCVISVISYNELFCFEQLKKTVWIYKNGKRRIKTYRFRRKGIRFI